MASVEIKMIPTAEEAFPLLNFITAYAFTASPPVREVARRIERFKHADGYNQYYVLFEDGELAASAGAGAMTQNVRGVEVPIAGVFLVATHPNKRRKGHAFRILQEMMAQERERGHGFSTLYPFRESFYERLGYVTWPSPKKVSLNLRALLPLFKQGYGENVELVELIPNNDIYLQFVRNYRKGVHGMAAFNFPLPLDPEYSSRWMALSRVDGKLDGLMIYKLEGSSPTKFKFEIERFYYLSSASLYEMLGWIARHIDQTNEVHMTVPAFEQPNTWFHDLEITLGQDWIPPMARVLDIEKLNGLPAGVGTFNAQISAPTCPWNEGVWRFESQDGKLSVAPVSRQADCQLTIQGLSALVYGTNPPTSFRHRGWGSVPLETAAQMGRMFPLQIPHLHEYF